MDNNELHNVGSEFILAGNATFTVVGQTTRYTYNVRKSEYNSRDYFFVSVLTGQNNESDYSNIGMLNPQTGALRETRNATVPLTAPSAVALAWTLKRLFTTGNAS